MTSRHDAIDQAHELLDGMLRERSGGPGAVLTTLMNVGVGTA